MWTVNGHCYFPLATRATWNVSRDNCANAGAHLVTITSAAEQNFVQALVGATNRWIALSRFGAPTFNWLGGEAVTYTNWDTSEPNASGPPTLIVALDAPMSSTSPSPGPSTTTLSGSRPLPSGR